MCVFPDIPINNERYISMDFDVLDSSVLHGFAGYFDSVLYDDLHMSELTKDWGEGFICEVGVA